MCLPSLIEKIVQDKQSSAGRVENSWSQAISLVCMEWRKLVWAKQVKSSWCQVKKVSRCCTGKDVVDAKQPSVGRAS